MSIINGLWPPQPIDIAHARNDEDLRAELARAPAGNAAIITGYLTGAEEVADNTPNLAPRAPGHGRPCHDHSGGEHGRPLFRSIWTLSFDGGQQYASTNVSQQGLLARFIGLSVNDNDFVASDSVAFSPHGVYVPGCDPEIGAYAHLGIQVKLRKYGSHSLLAADTLTFLLENITTRRTVELAITPNGTGIVDVASDNTNNPSELLRAAPGQMNLVRPFFEAELTGSGSARNVQVELLELELGVYEI